MTKEILVFVEVQGGSITNTSKSVFTIAKVLAKESNMSVSALIGGDTGLDDLANQAIGFGADKVYVYNHTELKSYRSRPFARIMSQTLKEHAPEIVLYGFSSTSTDFAPIVSTMHNTALITGVSSLEWNNNTLIAKIRINKDNLIMMFAIKGTIRMVILAIGAYAVEKPDSEHKGEIIVCTPNFETTDLIEDVLESQVVEKKVDLSEAKFILSGGRGVGGKEQFKIIFDSAATLGAEVGTSRAVYDSGWTDTDRHIGQTGQTVAPDIYLACGISGAIQHLAGIKKSKAIVVINTDPEAPIWEVASYGIVGDLHKVLPLLVKKVHGS